jgi:hypothetical protein
MQYTGNGSSLGSFVFFELSGIYLIPDKDIPQIEDGIKEI